jgi:hypothetical protein
VIEESQGTLAFFSIKLQPDDPQAELHAMRSREFSFLSRSFTNAFLQVGVRVVDGLCSNTTRWSRRFDESNANALRQSYVTAFQMACCGRQSTSFRPVSNDCRAKFIIELDGQPRHDFIMQQHRAKASARFFMVL